MWVLYEKPQGSYKFPYDDPSKAHDKISLTCASDLVSHIFYNGIQSVSEYDHRFIQDAII